MLSNAYTAQSESSNPVTLDEHTFRKVRRIAYEQAGIEIKECKQALVVARLAKRLRALGFNNEKEYVAYLENDPSGMELVHFLNVISTNFTSFFREPIHFELLCQAILQWLKQGQTDFKLWSCASSSGEEPYTMVMTLGELLSAQFFDFKVLATDISTTVLEQAMDAIYDERQLAGISTPLRLKYFSRISAGALQERRYQLKAKYRKRVVFSRLNLAQAPFPMRGPFDAIFCRNVMLYFDRRVRHTLIEELERLLKPGGLLFIGHSESLSDFNTGLCMLRPSVYSNI